MPPARLALPFSLHRSHSRPAFNLQLAPVSTPQLSLARRREWTWSQLPAIATSGRGGTAWSKLLECADARRAGVSGPGGGSGPKAAQEVEEGGLGGLLGDEEDKGNEGKRRAWSGGAAVPRTRTCWGSLRRCTVAWARMRRRALRRTFGEEAWGAARFPHLVRDLGSEAVRTQLDRTPASRLASHAAGPQRLARLLVPAAAPVDTACSARATGPPKAVARNCDTLSPIASAAATNDSNRSNRSSESIFSEMNIFWPVPMVPPPCARPSLGSDPTSN
eukprot:XP_001699528.1 predicted protein [Chlamydomonas reinhardtii]